MNYNGYKEHDEEQKKSNSSRYRFRVFRGSELHCFLFSRSPFLFDVGRV